MRNNITMRDIADQLGVSSVTVSKALGDKEGVSEELKEKIKQTASEMGYRMNSVAKSMRAGFSYNLGVIMAERYTDYSQSFYHQFFEHISKASEEYKYSAILHILTTDDEDHLILPRVYHEQKVDGLVVLGQISGEYIEALDKVDVPVVFLDFYTDNPEMDCVITDNFYGMYELTNYLIHKGHRDIAFVGNLHSTSSIQDRFLGFYKSLLEHKIPLREASIINDRDDKGHSIDLQLPEVMPTAFACNCDRVAYNLINTLNKKGYQIPRDCSVVGFDNDLFSALTEPKLTTVEVNMAEMAKLAVKTTIKKMANKSLGHGRVSIKGKVIYRDSVSVPSMPNRQIDEKETTR
ncbi:MAG: LacI family DNA-binding transcriptional regulator [Gorillibacterium sp.]|nr:LacI family DNA-binding transcriptional regulator [Gorillibacterium sp.]